MFLHAPTCVNICVHWRVFILARVVCVCLCVEACVHLCSCGCILCMCECTCVSVCLCVHLCYVCIRAYYTHMFVRMGGCVVCAYVFDVHTCACEHVCERAHCVLVCVCVRQWLCSCAGHCTQ